MVYDTFAKGVERKMKIALYGLPCAGKTTLLASVSNLLPVINGGEELKKLAGTIVERREKLLEFLKGRDNYFIDGHYQFVNNGKTEIAFTTENEIFDVFMYLYQHPKTILERIQKSEKNQKFLPISEEGIDKWQKDEIDSLRKICHDNDKDFFIIDDYNTDYTCFVSFCKDVLKGFSNVAYARKIASETNFDGDEIVMFDGDKTITKSDTSKVLLDFKTDIFDNNFYTGYQFWIQDKIINKKFDKDEMRGKIDELEINLSILDNAKNALIISSGLQEIWTDIIGKKLGIRTYAGKFISAETKFFVAKFLKERYKVTAYGDSKNDLFMLKCANKGILVINNHLSRSLKKEEIQGLDILNFGRHFYILNEDETLNKNEKLKIESLIEITKSDSGICGSTLAKAHFELGKFLCRYLSALPVKDSTLISLERSGHFISDGIYMNFDCRFETYNSKFQPLPGIKTKNVILVDGVINNGKSMLETIQRIKDISPSTRITVVAGVVNVDALSLFDLYDLIAVRTSKNKFTGCNVKIQKGNFGPDTADRLFNQLN